MFRLTSIRKAYGDLVAVADVSLDVARGEFFGLLGPNGAGKSTTINVAVGLLEPDQGTADVNGRGSPLRAEVRREIGLAPQALAIYDELTGRENLEFFGRLYGLRGGVLRRRVDEMLDRVGLRGRERDRVGAYSGGMKRRINLAAALIHDPPLVVLDEPTVGVDPQSRNAIFELLAELKRAGRTILYTTHYMEEAQRLCDRVAIIDHGRVLALDSVDGLVAAHGGRQMVRIERADGIEELQPERPLDVLAKVAGDARVLGLHIERPTLETVFLNLTGRSLRD